MVQYSGLSCDRPNRDAQCIEDLAERFNDDRQEALLELVRSHLSSETTTTSKDAAAAAAAAEEAPVMLPNANADADLDDAEPDEDAEIDEEMALIDEAYGGTRANEQVENDIDEVGES